MAQDFTQLYPSGAEPFIGQCCGRGCGDLPWRENQLGEPATRRPGRVRVTGSSCWDGFLRAARRCGRGPAGAQWLLHGRMWATRSESFGRSADGPWPGQWFGGPGSRSGSLAWPMTSQSTERSGDACVWRFRRPTGASQRLGAQLRSETRDRRGPSQYCQPRAENPTDCFGGGIPGYCSRTAWAP